MLHLILGQEVGKDQIDAGLRSDRPGRRLTVSGQHRDLDAKRLQLAYRFSRFGAHRILQRDHARNLVSVQDDRDRLPFLLQLCAALSPDREALIVQPGSGLIHRICAGGRSGQFSLIQNIRLADLPQLPADCALHSPACQRTRIRYTAKLEAFLVGGPDDGIGKRMPGQAFNRSAYGQQLLTVIAFTDNEVSHLRRALGQRSRLVERDDGGAGHIFQMRASLEQNAPAGALGNGGQHGGHNRRYQSTW
ncbi:hypothetical protein D3C71_1392800 [compost metagenome]